VAKSAAKPSAITSPETHDPIPQGSPWEIGLSYLIRTVTMIQVGRLIAIYPAELLLESASWVADTGRFHDALTTGKLNEIEPFPDRAIVGRGAIVDAAIWPHDLPTAQK
jgi:hypothetical protein